MVRLSRLFWLFIIGRWPVPRSLATTDGISIDFFSSGYLDVSVLRVRFHILCIQIWIIFLRRLGSPIRTPPDQSLFADSPKIFAGYHVLHRLLLPRHPPYALNYFLVTLNNSKDTSHMLLFKTCNLVYRYNKPNKKFTCFVSKLLKSDNN